MARKGAVNVSLAVNAKGGIVAGPSVTVRGLTMDDDEDFELALEDLEDTAKAAFQRLKHQEREDDEAGGTGARPRRAQGGGKAVAQAAACRRDGIAHLECAAGHLGVGP